MLKNETSSPSLFWGQSLLSLYYLVTSHAYYDASREKPWGHGTDTYSAFINLTRQSTASVGTPDEALSDDFFHIYCTTKDNLCTNNTITSLSQGGGTGAEHLGSLYPDNMTRSEHPKQGNMVHCYDGPWAEGYHCPQYACGHNPLANLTSNVTSEVDAWIELQKLTAHEVPNSIVKRGSTLKLDTSLAQKSFDPSITPAPTLGINTSYFSTTYICQKECLNRWALPSLRSCHLR